MDTNQIISIIRNRIEELGIKREALEKTIHQFTNASNIEKLLDDYDKTNVRICELDDLLARIRNRSS